jgi:glycosyltransferase involved in cell wall biosynthesis
MRIKIQQFLFGVNHSWSIVGQNLGREFIKLGHDVDFISTDGFDQKYCPNDLLPFKKDVPTGKYDLQLSYTAPHNWPNYLNPNLGGKRFAIWNYEYNIKQNNGNHVLPGFGKFYKATDLVLPSSNFTKEVFINMGIPCEKMIVVPHGINLSDFAIECPWTLKTKRSKKILLNIAQPHRRKAIPLALESFGKAFTRNDDVCLVAKVFRQNNKGMTFDVDFNQLYKTFENKFKNHAEVEFVYDYIKDIADIYNACDINFSATHAECWHLPSLEAMASGKINIVPRYGGQLDFCNDANSLLIEGSIVRAPRDHLYWSQNPLSIHFEIDTNDAAKKLQQSVSDFISLKNKFQPNMIKTVAHFTWENAAKQILELANDR